MSRRIVKTDPPVKTLPLTLVPLSAHAEYPGKDATDLDARTDAALAAAERALFRWPSTPMLDAFRARWAHVIDWATGDVGDDYDADGRPTPEALASGRVRRGGKATW